MLTTDVLVLLSLQLEAGGAGEVLEQRLWCDVVLRRIELWTRPLSGDAEHVLEVRRDERNVSVRQPHAGVVAVVLEILGARYP